MSTPLTPYLLELSNWQSQLKNKWVLFDTDAIISIISYKAEAILEDFKELEVTNCIIHPAYVELFRTDNLGERTKRQVLYNKYSFCLLNLLRNDFNAARDIQVWLANKSCYPSPTDLYLGGHIATYSHDQILLLTGYLSDFPYALFVRKGAIVLQGEKQSKLLFLLTIDHSQLRQIKKSVENVS